MSNLLLSPLPLIYPVPEWSAVTTHVSDAGNMKFTHAIVTIIASTLLLFITDAPSLAQAQAAQIFWESCPHTVDRPEAECGRIEVPLDYNKPKAKKISVGFIRFKSETARDTVFAHPGGPGIDVYSHFGNVAETEFPEEYFSQFHIVAVQPRGLTGSTALDCLNRFHPHTSVDYLYRNGAMHRESCEAAHPGLAHAITTENTARDWEEVRKALKLNKISIHGLSYGAILGSTYATLFPAQTNRVILESGFDPDLMWKELFALQETGYQNALHDFFTWAAKNNARYQLGATPYAVYATWADRVKTESGIWPPVTPPKAVPEDFPLEGAGESWAKTMNAIEPNRAETENHASQLATRDTLSKSPLYLGTYGDISSPAHWEQLAQYLANPPVDQPQDAYNQTIRDEQGRAFINARLMQLAIVCNEAHSPLGSEDSVPQLWEQFLTPTETATLRYDHTSGPICDGLPAATKVPTFKGTALAVRPLQIQATGDPQAPYKHFRHMQKQMNSHLVTVKGPGHMQFGAGNQNVDQLVIDYLSGVNPTVTELPGYFG